MFVHGLLDNGGTGIADSVGDTRLSVCDNLSTCGSFCALRAAPWLSCAAHRHRPATFPIVYNNGYEHVELDVWNDTERKQNVRMLEWVFKLKRLAEDKFHRPIWNTPAK